MRERTKNDSATLFSAVRKNLAHANNAAEKASLQGKLRALEHAISRYERGANVQPGSDTWQKAAKALRVRLQKDSIDATRTLLELFVAWNAETRLTRRDRRIVKPPGSVMQSVAEFLCSRKTLEQVVKPIIADMRFEYWEALARGRTKKAAFVRIRALLSLCFALGFLKLMQTAVKVWKGAS